ncbi:MAG: pyridoxamine 5'-phosphate oxidase [Saprospiraceae bacterium]
MAKVDHLREDYQRGALERADLIEDPVEQFGAWIGAAINDELAEPNAMTLATVDSSGRPNARIVLLKGFDERGFVFYTNYQSEKAKDLDANPSACLVFNWLQHERQVRIRGAVQRISLEETTKYFHSRPKGSQIGAWASPQSQVIRDRWPLESRVESLKTKYADAEALPVPEHWGGYRLAAEEIEFWQGRSSRLHDRFRFCKTDGDWKIDRLAP